MRSRQQCPRSRVARRHPQPDRGRRGRQHGSDRGNVVVGNYLGTNAAGTAATANGNAGVGISSSNNTIGGTTAADRNVISGNTAYGVEISGGASNNIVLGNYVGVDASGSSAIANGV